MKISKFLMWLSIILVVCITYVWQKTEMVKVSYNIRESENRVSLLLDQNRNLVYNVDSMESPRNLDMKLTNNEIKFEMANDRRVINLSGQRASVYERIMNSDIKNQISKLQSMFQTFIPF